jgi:hypothetical protein
MLPLPIPDEKGRRVILARTGLHAPDELKVADLFKAQMMIADVLLEEDDRVTVCGTVNVMDHSNTSLALVAQFSPSLAKKASTLFQVNTAKSTYSLSVNYYICFVSFEAKALLSNT